ncbi:GntR family transcriptional regulator [Streptomyces fructofermentans]|uniref:GntR family transcriptional regulator n=1 Tax=Streptomyces fructofermentans TaxID=152141 RepID=UPI00379E7737
MEKAGSREAYGSAGDPSEAGPGTPAPRVPPQFRAGGAGRERPAVCAPGPGAGALPSGAAAAAGPPERTARGEHTHSEAPIPRPRLTHGSATGVPAVSAAPRPVIQRASVRGQILDALRAALVGGDLAPGEVYSAPVLGERFGVSATPVREAMQQLAIEGAVEVVPNRGFRVVRRGARELAELAEIRALVEVPVILRLARTVSASCWAELRPLAEATTAAAACGDRGRYAESDRAFHGALLALAGNRQLVRIADELHRRAQWPLAGAPASRRRADLLADAAQHSALLDALTAQDLPAVQSVVHAHFTDC